MVSNPNIKIASFWISSTTNPDSSNRSVPTVAEVQAYKAAGFNTVMFAEANYGYQMGDLDTALASPNSNQMLTVIKMIQGQGMKCFVLLDPKRYGTGDGIANKAAFINSSFYKNKMIAHIGYLKNYVDGIELEEPLWSAASATVMTAFFQACKVAAGTKIFGANINSNSITNIVGGGFQYSQLDVAGTFSYIAPQTQRDASGQFPNSVQQTSYNTWSGLMTRTPIIPYIKHHAGTADNIYMADNCAYAVAQGWGLVLWPAGYLNSVDLTNIGNSLRLTALDIRSTPAGAAIRIRTTNGWGNYGITPRVKVIVNELVNTGPYLIELTAPDGTIWTTPSSIYVANGQTVIVDHTFVAAPPPLPSTGKVTITSTPTGASVYMNSQLVGITPHTHTDLAGESRTFELRADGYISKTDTIAFTAGMNLMKSYNLESTASGITIQTTPPGAQIKANGLIKGASPATIQLEAGTYVLELTLAGYKSIVENITVVQNQDATMTYYLVKSCAPIWSSPPVCTQPLDGTEMDGCGNTRPNEACNPPPGTGTLNTVSFPANAEMYLNGEFAGILPNIQTITAGKYTVKVKLPGYEELQDVFTLEGGDTIVKVYTLKALDTITSNLSNLVIPITLGLGILKLFKK